MDDPSDKNSKQHAKTCKTQFKSSRKNGIVPTTGCGDSTRWSLAATSGNKKWETSCCQLNYRRFSAPVEGYRGATEDVAKNRLLNHRARVGEGVHKNTEDGKERIRQNSIQEMACIAEEQGNNRQHNDLKLCKRQASKEYLLVDATYTKKLDGEVESISKIESVSRKNGVVNPPVPDLLQRRKSLSFALSPRNSSKISLELETKKENCTSAKSLRRRQSLAGANSFPSALKTNDSGAISRTRFSLQEELFSKRISQRYGINSKSKEV